MDECKAWVIALGSLPEVLGPADLPKLNEGLRYLFKELREAQAVYIGGSHLDGVYSSLVAVTCFSGVVQLGGREGLVCAPIGTGERVVGAWRGCDRAAAETGEPEGGET